MGETGKRARGTRKPRSRRRRVGILVMLGILYIATIGTGVSGIVAGLHARAQMQPVPGGIQTTGAIVGVHVERGFKYG